MFRTVCFLLLGILLIACVCVCVCVFVRETSQFSSKGKDFIGNLDRITVLKLITELASDSLNEPYHPSLHFTSPAKPGTLHLFP